MRIFFTFLFLLTLLACKKNEPTTSNIPIYVVDSFYFKGKINGENISWVVPSHKNDTSFKYISNAYHGITDLSANCIEGYCYYLIAGSEIRRNVSEVKPRISVDFNMATKRKGKEEIISWFSPGTKSYAPSVRPVSDLLNPFYNGVNVYYVDQNGNDWSTLRGSQQGSVFESGLFIDEPRNDIATQKIWKAKFSCKLYNSVGLSTNLESGEIFGPVLLPHQ